MRKMFRCIAYVHDMEIIHRDLKLENFIMSTAGDIKLVDFGTAISFEDEKERTKMTGTPYYIAPEVLMSNASRPPYDEKCDIWSLGIILYMLLSGRPPFSGESND